MLMKVISMKSGTSPNKASPRRRSREVTQFEVRLGRKKLDS